MRLFKVHRCLLLLAALLPAISALASSASSNIDRSGFYAAYSAASLDGINNLITKLENGSSSSESKAFLGALLMRKAGLIKGKREQLSLFKKGRLLLEKEIEEWPANAEYRFLRITIQEQAPKILGYNKNIEQDKKVLTRGFKELNSETRKAIATYAKKSPLLKDADLS
ncbi:hypothetical protein [uncultured Acetobacteroides sp.]|uniref:hypothetical protein n=1 Tax=uncultured Acetobacteroides sp. TaxID=1760811 RepID=UPI0029F58122|nr:hypothetical protein [uncultured Acetobacteroides sp.]